MIVSSLNSLIFGVRCPDHLSIGWMDLAFSFHMLRLYRFVFKKTINAKDPKK